MRIGLIVNPLAGLGGPLALKGSDDAAAVRAAAAVGADHASARAAAALRRVDATRVTLLTAKGAMGEDAASAAGLRAQLVFEPPALTGPGDTMAAARALLAQSIDLLLFAGGDGTARDLLAAGTGEVPVLGVPAGVKMHSAVFATSPAAAAAAINALVDPPFETAAAEVIDRVGAGGAPQLFGVLPGLATSRRQPAKASGASDADADLAAAALVLAHELRHAPLAFVGPGATMALVKAQLGGEGTLLGVDAYVCGAQVARDADAATLAALAREHSPCITLGVIGGQGFLLGRGNQQLCVEVMRRAGRAGLTVLASKAKLAALPGGALLVDSGDPDLDVALAGYLPVRTAPRATMMMRLNPA